MYAAGILPITWLSGELYVLVGKDARDDTWSDFAGKCEKCDKDIQSTAAREFWEESYGVLADVKTMRNRLDPRSSLMVRGKTQNGHPYYCFVTEVPYVGYIRDAFHKHLLFVRQRNVHRMYIEKTDVMYVSIEALYGDDFPKRSVFKETMTAYRHVFDEIAAAGPQGFADVCAKNAVVNSPSAPTTTHGSAAVHPGPSRY
jgi:8-oxo-dGTP pyrophosphatase MutT (NUDIX family)